MQHLSHCSTSKSSSLFSMWLMCRDIRPSLLLAFKMHWEMKLWQLFSVPVYNDNWSLLLLHDVFHLILLIKHQRSHQAIQPWSLLSNSNLSSLILFDTSWIIAHKTDFTWLNNSRTFVKRKNWRAIIKIS